MVPTSADQPPPLPRAPTAPDARYSERAGVDVASLRFFFYGRCISGDDTPRELNMQDDDMIYVDILPPTAGYFSDPAPRASQDEIERARAARLARFA